jgi:DNA-binding NtrC family response regulator
VAGHLQLSIWLPACLMEGMSQRILIIDDDDQLASVYKEYLVDKGHQVDCAHELEEAQTLLAHFAYSVVITDLRLTKLGFGGLDLIKYIRDLSLNTRIIVFTGYGWPELKAEASAQHVDAFLRKPAKLSELAETVGELVGASA